MDILYLFGSLLAVLLLLLPLVIWHAHNTSYICKNCGHRFAIPVWKDYISPHRLLKCPNCHKWAWQKEISNKKLK